MDKNLTNLEVSVSKNLPNIPVLSSSQARLNSNSFPSNRNTTEIRNDTAAIPFEDAFDCNRRRQVN